MTRTSARNSSGPIRSPAHSAIAVSKLNDSCGEQRTAEVRPRAVQKLYQCESSRCGVGGMLARGQRLGLAGRGNECLGQQQLQGPAPSSAPQARSAAGPPARRPTASIETAVSGSSPVLRRSRPGASNAARANFDGGSPDIDRYHAGSHAQ